MILKAHAAVYSEIKSIIQRQIKNDHKVLPLPVLRETYINELLEQNQQNNDFRSEKLKKRLENDPNISELIAFSKIEWKRCVPFWLIFSSKIPIAEAVAASYLLASKDHLKDRAKYLQDSIFNAFIKSKEMTWPPTLEDVTSEPLPEELQCSAF